MSSSDPFNLMTYEAGFMRGYQDMEPITEEERLRLMSHAAENLFIRICEAYPDEAQAWLSRRERACLRHSGPPVGENVRVSLPERVFHSKILASIGEELAAAREFRDTHGYLPASYDQPAMFTRALSALEGAFGWEFEGWQRWLREVAETNGWIDPRELPFPEIDPDDPSPA